MGLEAKDPAAVAPHPLENPVAIEQAMVIDADLGVLFVIVLAGDVDLEGHGESQIRMAKFEWRMTKESGGNDFSWARTVPIILRFGGVWKACRSFESGTPPCERMAGRL